MASVIQKQILLFMKSNKEYSLEEIRNGVNYVLHHNSNHHFSTLLSRMVKREMLIRVRKGIFAKPNPIIKYNLFT